MTNETSTIISIPIDVVGNSGKKTNISSNLTSSISSMSTMSTSLPSLSGSTYSIIRSKSLRWCSCCVVSCIGPFFLFLILLVLIYGKYFKIADSCYKVNNRF